jgi:SAM-dependent methyltransferase
MTPNLGDHWDNAYAQGDTGRSWFQEEATTSLEIVDALCITPDAGVIDVGGGASTLVDGLIQRGFDDVTVLDISARGLEAAQRRLGESNDRVTWIVTDLLTWQPARTYSVWHDRAVLHFLTDHQDRQRYVKALRAGTKPDAVAVVGCFALDGPETCSGLPVARYDAEGLSQLLGAGWTLEFSTRREHPTPSGAVQPFTWVAFRRHH